MVSLSTKVSYLTRACQQPLQHFLYGAEHVLLQGPWCRFMQILDIMLKGDSFPANRKVDATCPHLGLPMKQGKIENGPWPQND